MRLFFSLLLLATIEAYAADSNLQLLPFANAGAQGVLPMQNGSVAIYGSMAANSCSISTQSSCNQTQAPLLSVLDSTGNQTATLPASALGGGDSTLTSAALDSSGNIWITGHTDSDDFPLVHPLFSHKTDYQQTGFVARLDPTLKILFSTFLGGQENPLPGLSSPTNIALDASGNVYVVGTTEDSGFPTTAPVLGAGSPSNSLSPISYAFISKISSDGSSLLYSRLLGGDGSPCFGGSRCVDYQVYTQPSSIAFDRNGNLTLAGGTNATNFPITAGEYKTGGGAFVTRVAADGSQLLWSTLVGIPGNGLTAPPPQWNTVQQIALDAQENIFVIGEEVGPIPTTQGALQSTVPETVPSGFALKLSPDATRLLYATELGGTSATKGSTLCGLALDSAGNAWISGNTHSAGFPGLTAVGPDGLDFALELNADASALQQIFPLVPGTVTQPLAFDSNGSLLLLGSAGNLLRLNPATAQSAPAVFAITNSAVPRTTAGIAPGELLTIYGTALGPASPLVGMPDANGLYPRQLGGVTVQFGCGSGPRPVPAPLLYVSATQINLQVPFSVCDAGTVTIQTPTTTLPALTAPIIGTIGVFGAVNQDGTLNSAVNPAAEGTIVSIYLTGLGDPNLPYPPEDGAISVSAVSAFQSQIEVLFNYPLALSYAGTAPSLINGLDQINVQLPAGIPDPSLYIRTLSVINGTPWASSGEFEIYTR